MYYVSCVILSHDSPSVTQVIAWAHLLAQLIMPQTYRLSAFEVPNISRSTCANDTSRAFILTK